MSRVSPINRVPCSVTVTLTFWRTVWTNLLPKLEKCRELELPNPEADVPVNINVGALPVFPPFQPPPVPVAVENSEVDLTEFTAWSEAFGWGDGVGLEAA